MMKAVVLKKGKNKKDDNTVMIQERPIPNPSSNQLLIKITANALNHRDLWMIKNLYPAIVDGMTIGADGCGTVVSQGSNVSTNLIGKKVMINPSLYFGTNKFHILGQHPSAGTFAEYITVDSDHVVEKPFFLSDSEGAAYCLAGLTAYRALFTKGELKKDQNVLITGIGGGVALFALQFAVAFGANVYVTSSCDEKIAKALQFGAKKGFNYKKPNFKDELTSIVGGYDLVIDGAGGETLNLYVLALKIGGKLVTYGATAGLCNDLDIRRIFLKQIELRGTTMGSKDEFNDMIKLISNHQIIPIVDSVYDLNDYQKAFDRLKSSQQFGKVVMNVNQHTKINSKL